VTSSDKSYGTRMIGRPLEIAVAARPPFAGDAAAAAAIQLYDTYTTTVCAVRLIVSVIAPYESYTCPQYRRENDCGGGDQ